MSKTYSKTRILVECALMIAIGTVLSNIKFFTMPNGGSITLLTPASSRSSFNRLNTAKGIRISPRISNSAG